MVDEPGGAELSYLQLSSEIFAALAAGDVDGAVVGVLQASERSRRLLLLQHVAHRCLTDPSLLAPLGGADATWELLESVQHHNPAALDNVLAYPHTGMWLAHVVRRLEETVPAASDPPSIDVGGLASLAASAALVARMRFEIAVHLVHGRVLFPGIGAVVLDEGDGGRNEVRVATVRAEASGVTVTHDDRQVTITYPLEREQPGWTPVTILHVPGRRELSIRLDHVDPAPIVVGLPAPVAPRTPSLWRERFAEAWRMLDADHLQEAEALSAGLSSVVPIGEGGRGVLAGSSPEGFGSASIRLPGTAADLACALVHEFRHSVLNGLLHLVDLCQKDLDGAVHYAPWRDDPRPLLGVLHGAYAFTAVTEFWRVRRQRDSGQDARRAELEFALWRRQTQVTLDQLTRSVSLTPLGRHFVDRLQERVTAFESEEVPSDSQRLALFAARSHQAGWRARHVRPAPPWIEEAARCWRKDEPAPQPGDEDIVNDPSACGLNQVFVLACLSHAGSAGSGPEVIETALAGDPQQADQLVVRGDVDEGLRRYLAEIVADPDDPHPWTSLGPALAGGEALPGALRPAVRLLVERPERPRAVYRELRAAGEQPDVLELADWLAAIPS